MENLGKLLSDFFNSQLTTNVSLIVALVGLLCEGVISIFSKRKVIKSDLTETLLATKLSKNDKKIEELTDAVAVVANMVIALALGSTNLDMTIKKNIVGLSDKLNKISSIDLTAMSKELLETIATHVPGVSLTEKTDKLLEEIKSSEETLDNALNTAAEALEDAATSIDTANQDSIDNIKL